MPRIYFTLKFDVEMEQVIRSLWRKIADAGIPVEGLGGYRPHLTLAGYVAEDVTAFEQGIVPVMAAFRRFPVHFESIGIFPTGNVIFLQPRLTEQLLTLQKTVLETFYGPEWPALSNEHFGLGRWMPHCMLTRRVSIEQLQRVLQICLQERYSIQGEVEGVGLRVHPEVVDQRYFAFEAI